MSHEDSANTIRRLWAAFLRDSQPGCHTMRTCPQCHAEATRNSDQCRTCAADMLLAYGIDVTKPQWSRDSTGRIVQNWHPEYTIQDMEKESEP